MAADRTVSGHVAVLRTRVEALRGEITARDWAQVEFQHDRVSRSLSKLEQLIEDRDATPADKPAGWRPSAGELRDMEEAHAQGLHDEIPREFCPECEHQGRRA